MFVSSVLKDGQRIVEMLKQNIFRPLKSSCSDLLVALFLFIFICHKTEWLLFRVIKLFKKKKRLLLRMLIDSLELSGSRCQKVVVYFMNHMLPSEIRRWAFKSYTRLFHLSCCCLCFTPMVPGLPDAQPSLITQPSVSLNA